MGYPLYLTGISLFVSVLIEVLIRWLRLANYIRYSPSARIGYFPLPLSSGYMRGRYRWRINAMGLRADFDEAIKADAIVLVGDSIVEGGAFVDQSDTIGPQIERRIGRRVYPVGAGGWGLANELAFLKANPSLLNARTCVIISNSDDLGAANEWSNKFTHPTQPPRSHLLFFAGRVVLAAWYKVRHDLRVRSERPHAADATIQCDEHISWLKHTYRGRLIWVMYPDRKELEQGTQPCVELKRLASQFAEIVDLGSEPDWNHHCYGDRIHPSAIGRVVLADVIASAVTPA